MVSGSEGQIVVLEFFIKERGREIKDGDTRKWRGGGLKLFAEEMSMTTKLVLPLFLKTFVYGG